MRQVFTFDRLAVAVRHWFEIDVDDASMEHGARIEFCPLQRGPHRGSESAGQRAVVETPIWRADLFDRLDGAPGSFDAGHYHPYFDGLEPCPRVWDTSLAAEPWAWLTHQLSDVRAAAAASGVEISDEDTTGIAAATPDIVAAAQRYAPTRCTTVTGCFALTSDGVELLQRTIKKLTDPTLLNRDHVALWESHRA